MARLLEKILKSIWLAPMLVALLFLILAPRPESMGEWYPLAPEFHLQMMAFEQGKLRLADHPAGASHDWAWGSGLQQPWGLGTAALEYPFFKLARLAGADFIPEAPVFLFWMMICALLLRDALLKWRVAPEFANTLVLFFLSHPILFNMLQQRYAVYETVIAYGVLCGASAYALTIAGLSKEGARRAWICALLLGFFSFVRPTIAVYSIVSICFLVLLPAQGFSVWRRARSILPAFLPGVILHLWTNQQRFGSFLDFGHGLVTSGNVGIDYPVRLANHMYTKSWLATLVEITGLLFSNTVIDGTFGDFITNKSFFPGQIEMIRLRELSFSAYSPASLLLVCGGILLLGAQLLPAEKFKSLRASKIESLSIGWGLAAFTALFLFYSHVPVYCARYAVDFVPSLGAIGTGLALFGYRWFNGPRSPLPRLSSVARPAISLALILVFIIGGVWSGEHWVRARGLAFFSKEEFAERITQVNRNLAGRYAEIPRQYECGKIYPNFGLRYNFDGWHPDSCRAEPIITLYLPSSRCLELEVELPDDDLSQIDEIRIKRGLVFLDRSTDESDSTSRHKYLRYCGPEGTSRNLYGIELISIAWVSVNQFATGQQSHLRLLAVRSLD